MAGQRVALAKQLQPETCTGFQYIVGRPKSVGGFDGTIFLSRSLSR